MRFVDREVELELLDEHLGRDGAGLFVLYGRRRIGKTALLEKALAGLPAAAYHVGTRSTATEELGRLSRTLAEAWDIPLLRAQPLQSWDAFLALLEGLDGTRVLALDELPYLVEGTPSLPGLLQASWDRKLATGKLKLVVCGSSVSIMADAFFSPRSPLFGRRTGQLRLGPLQPHHLAEAFQKGPVETLELAAVFGGVPGYLSRLDPELDLLENLRRRVLQRGEPLYEEIPFLLREELREPRVYHAVLATVAQGARKFGEISSKVGLDRANLSRYLSILVDLELLEREVPVTERHPEKSRKGIYRIADPFVASWFAFVHPHRDMLERGLVDAVVQNHVKPGLPRFLSFAVEPVIRQLFADGPLAELVPFEAAFAGRYWSPSAELDVVLLNGERRQAFIAEVKWGQAKTPASCLEDLRRRVAAEHAFAGLEITCAVVSRAGFAGSRALPSGDRGMLVDVGKMRW